MLVVSGNACSEHYSITVRPNCSLSRTGTLCVFCLVALFCLLIALVFAVLGAWPVLAFSGLELLALGAAFLYTCRHAQDYERLTIDHGRITLERHRLHHDEQVELNGHWARVIMEPASSGECQRLALRCHGRDTEFGHLLSAEERYVLGSQLSSRLGNFPMGNS